MTWQPIEAYPLPNEPWDYDHPEALFYDRAVGINVGRCILVDIFEGDQGEYYFEYGRESLRMQPTHWMPLPAPPC